MSKRLRAKAETANEAHATKGDQRPATRSSPISALLALHSKVRALDGALPVRAIDPAFVFHSKWSNRHPTSFDCAEYFALREEIRSAGGNVQPIKVRPLDTQLDRSLLPGSTPFPDAACFEIVYGHRRHKACLELGLPVLALIEQISDAELFAQMDRENRNRENLSPWEQGVMYFKAIEGGLFSSMRQLASAIGRDPATTSRAMALAQLPAEVVQAFRSPNDLQYRWAKPLSDAIQKDRKLVLRRAEQLAGKARDLSPTTIFESLVGTPAVDRALPECEIATLCHGGKRIGEVLRDSRQRTVVRFHRPLTLPEYSAMVHALQKAFQKL